MNTVLQDFRFTVRMLAKSPGFTAVAVLTLALGIGVNSGVFALVNGVIFRPVVKHKPDEVVSVYNGRRDAKQDYRRFSYAEYSALREPNEVFADLGAWSFATIGVGIGDRTRRSTAFVVSDGYFRIHAVQPAEGRLFTALESRPAAGVPVAVVSHSLWKRLGGSSHVAGSTVRLNGIVFNVVGVMPRGFSGGNTLFGPDLWLPLGARDLIDRNALPLSSPQSYALNLIARLHSGLSIASAEARLPALAARLDAVGNDVGSGLRVVELEAPSRFAFSESPSRQGPLGMIWSPLLGMSGVVLLIACLNLANMILARGTARSREFAVRLAVGAPRRAIIRQLLIEGLSLSVAGGLLGLLIAAWGNRVLLSSFTGLFTALPYAFVLDLAPDLHVLAATFGFCVFATLIFSLGPAFRASRTDFVTDLKQGAVEGTNTRSINRFFAPRHVLVMSQIALSLVLLFAAGLFFRGALAASRIATGFEPKGGLVAELDYRLTNVTSGEMLQKVQAALDRAAMLPGVRRAALATHVPFGPVNSSRSVSVPGGSSGANGKPITLDVIHLAASSGYFEAIGVRMLRGRDFTPAESKDPDAKRVVIIDELLAKRLFPNAEALGQSIRTTRQEPDGSFPEMRIVGIVSAHRHDFLTAETQPRIFVPFARGFTGAAFLHVKLDRNDEGALVAGAQNLRGALRRLDPLIPLLALDRFADIVDRNVGVWATRLAATMFGAFAGIALVLAGVGVYGVKAYAVARRTREIGIRMALGSTSGDVSALIMRQGALQVALAATIGAFLSLGAGRVLANILYKVSPMDPLVLGAASVCLASATLAACWLPARRAAKVDPLVALRCE